MDLLLDFGAWLCMAVAVMKHLFQPVALENDHDEDREEEWYKQVKKPEDKQSRQHLGFWHLGHGSDEKPFEDPKAAGCIGPERRRERGDEDRKDGEVTRIAGVRQSEIDDPRRPEQFKGRRQHLPGGDLGSWIFQPEPSYDERPESENGTHHIDRNAGEENDACQAGGCWIGQKTEFLRQQSPETAELLGLKKRDEAAEEHGAEHEGEGANGDQDRDLCRAQTLGMIGAVPDHSARENSRADVVRECVGREGAKRDKYPGDIFHAKMEQRNPVVPGERSIGDKRRECYQQIMGGGNRCQAFPDFRPNGLALELPMKKPKRNGDSGKANHRPEKIENALHRSPGDLAPPHRPASRRPSWSCGIPAPCVHQWQEGSCEGTPWP